MHQLLPLLSSRLPGPNNKIIELLHLCWSSLEDVGGLMLCAFYWLFNQIIITFNNVLVREKIPNKIKSPLRTQKNRETLRLLLVHRKLLVIEFRIKDWFWGNSGFGPLNTENFWTVICIHISSHLIIISSSGFVYISSTKNLSLLRIPNVSSDFLLFDQWKSPPILMNMVNDHFHNPLCIPVIR